MPEVLDRGDTAWMLTATALVLFMTIPGLALFYAGLVRTKNVLSVLMQCLTLTALMSILWLVFGYSLAFDASGMEAGSRGLHAFIDGELDAAGRAEVEQWLARHPEDAARLAAYSRQKAALHAAFDQLAAFRTSACVVNGPAYGEGFGLVFGTDEHVHLARPEVLYAELLRLVTG